MARILIIDDEESVLTTLSSYLRLRGHEVIAAESEARGAELFKKEAPDIVLLDVLLKGRNGLDLLPRILAADAKAGVVMISGHADVKTAVRAMKLGAFDFLEKPIDTDRLDILIAHLDRELGLRRGIERLRLSWREENMFVGASGAIGDVLATAERAAASTLSILITGENGTGKEVLARFIHLASGRVGGPFVAVNCAALPPELIESALFGHRKGSFTGAHADRDGFFSAASGGTLFLDEIGDLPLHLQPKLLRVLENGEIQRVGSTSVERVDARIISASNRPLPAAIASGAFREDLYYRLGQLPIRIPSLRERREDIRGLASFFARSRGLTLSEEALDYMAAREWPGNVRELKNLIERVAVLARSDPVSGADLISIDSGGAAPPRPPDSLMDPAPLVEAKRTFEKHYIEARLRANGWSVKETAEELGLLPNNLSRKLAALGISLPSR